MKIYHRLGATFILCVSFAASAVSPWQIGQGKIDVSLWNSQRSIWLSSWCTEKKPCEALRALKMVEEKPAIAETITDEPAGVNPGSVSCRRVFDGQMFLARGKPGETQGFCRFKDGSLVSINGL